MYQYLTLFNGWLILHCMSIPHYVSLCSTVDGHLSCVHFLVTVNSAAINIPLQAFIWKPVFSSFGYINMSQICRWRHPHGRSDHHISTGYFMWKEKRRTWQDVLFHSVWTGLLWCCTQLFHLQMVLKAQLEQLDKTDVNFCFFPKLSTLATWKLIYLHASMKKI